MKKLFALCLSLFALNTSATVINFGPEATYVSGGAIVINLSTPTFIVGDATLDVTFQGDLNNADEGFDATLDGLLIGDFLDGTDAFIGDIVYTDTYIISESDMQSLIGDGSLVLVFDTYAAVDPITEPAVGPFLTSIQNGFSMAVQGSLTFNSGDRVPEPGTLALLGLGLLGLGRSALSRR